MWPRACQPRDASRSRVPSGSGFRKAIRPHQLRPETRRFVHHFELDAEQRVESAELEMTADNGFQVWVNDQLALQGDNFHVVIAPTSQSLLVRRPQLSCVLSPPTVPSEGQSGRSDRCPGDPLRRWQPARRRHRSHVAGRLRSRRRRRRSGRHAGRWSLERLALAQELGAYDMAPWVLNPAERRDATAVPAV